MKALILLIVSISLLAAHGAAAPPSGLDDKIGPWKNLYQGNSKLAGIYVSQYTEGPEPKSRWTGKHPAEIWYFFWDGSIRQILYDPDGSIFQDDRWHQKTESGHDYWRLCDFKYGNDLTLKRHPQIRKSLASDR